MRSLKSVVERLRKLWALAPGERLILARAWALFLAVELGLRLLPFGSLLGLCQRLARIRPASAATSGPSPSRLAWLVGVAGRCAPVEATCLKQALVLGWLLAREGARVDLGIGVARAGAFAAHAWIELGGQVLLGDPEVGQYEPLLRVSWGPRGGVR